MSLLLIAGISIVCIIWSKKLFSKWINPLSIYCISMGGLVFLYELKWLPYPDIIPIAWFLIILSFLSFLFGVLSVVYAFKLNNESISFSDKENISLPILADGGKTLKYSLIFFSMIGLFVALQRWYVLINYFGDISSVMLNAAIVYRLNVQREIKDFIPIIPAFIYVAIFLSGLYTAYKGKFSFLSFFPFITIILKQLTYFGRAEILLTLFEFFFTFFLFRSVLKKDFMKRFKFSKKNAIVASCLLLSLLVGSTSFIRLSRGNYENYLGVSKELKSMEDNLILSPSVYLYLSSDAGVLSKYLDSNGENTKFGENTFFIVHVFLSRIGLREPPSDFQKGYHIPMWTNTGTYIRELHADFGIIGLLIGSYLMGLLPTWLWFRFYKKNSLMVLALLVYLLLIIAFSFLVMITRANHYFISLALIILCIPIIEKIALRSQLKIV